MYTNQSNLIRTGFQTIDNIKNMMYIYFLKIRQLEVNAHEEKERDVRFEC